jgi:outer membrane protein OmpA-like peptidoglycan-associated protein
VKRRAVSSFRAALLALPMLLAACAPPPRPPVLGDVDQVRGGPAALEAKVLAPAAYAHAEKLRGEADAAYESGDLAAAQILGEQALAAYAHAHAVARITRADTRTEKGRAELGAAQAELAKIEADQARVAAEVEALDLKIKVVRDAQPLVPSNRADPDREAARLAAARALSVQARVLCAAARLLASDAPKDSEVDKLKTTIDEAVAGADKLDAALGPSATLAPIDQASRTRAACLSALTLVRRAKSPVTRASGAGDALLTELSQAGSWAPSRDDRGVFVALRGIFAGDALSSAGDAKVVEVAKIAAAHPTFPLAVVVHADKAPVAKDEAQLRARADAVVAALKKNGVTKVTGVVAGAAAPVVDPAGKDKARNARVEIVFITPETL